MAIQAGAPVVPVAIVGADQAMRKGSPFIWPATLRVRLGPPVETAGLTIYDRDRLMDAVRSSMTAMLASLRAERAGSADAPVAATSRPA
jgi:1-acyl-sn-glycerol-3-phosphate acyltransferase